MNNLPVTIEAVRHAAASIAGAICRTPVVAASALSELAGSEIYLKLETLQPIGSFKLRGGLNAIRSLSTMDPSGPATVSS